MGEELFVLVTGWVIASLFMCFMGTRLLLKFLKGENSKTGSYLVSGVAAWITGFGMLLLPFIFVVG